jgi:hypothetical protein
MVFPLESPKSIYPESIKNSSSPMALTRYQSRISDSIPQETSTKKIEIVRLITYHPINSRRLIKVILITPGDRKITYTKWPMHLIAFHNPRTEKDALLY